MAVRGAMYDEATLPTVNVLCRDMKGGVHLVQKSELINRPAGYVVSVSNADLLVVAQPETKVWDFPGGGCLPNETPRVAAIREFREETGLTVTEDLKLVTSFEELYFDLGTNRGWRSFRYFFSAANNSLEDMIIDIADSRQIRVSPTVQLVSSMTGRKRLCTPSSDYTAE